MIATQNRQAGTYQRDNRDPKGIWLGFSPGADASRLGPLFEQQLDFVVLGATANSTLPTDPRNSFIPIIQDLSKRGIPVFVVPDLNSASFSLDGRSMIDLKQPYESQVQVLAAGAFMLQTDGSRNDTVMRVITDNFRRGSSGLALGEAVCNEINNPDFNQRQTAIRERTISPK